MIAKVCDEQFPHHHPPTPLSMGCFTWEAANHTQVNNASPRWIGHLISTITAPLLIFTHAHKLNALQYYNYYNKKWHNNNFTYTNSVLTCTQIRRSGNSQISPFCIHKVASKFQTVLSGNSNGKLKEREWRLERRINYIMASITDSIVCP